jgi:hypothetical protein
VAEEAAPAPHKPQWKKIASIVGIAAIVELLTGSVRWAIHGHVPQLTNDYLFFCLTMSAYPLLIGFFTRRSGASMVVAGFCAMLLFVPCTITSAAATLEYYGSLAAFSVRMLSAGGDMIPTHLAFGLLGAWLAGRGVESPNSTPHTDARASAVPSQSSSAARAGERGR